MTISIRERHRRKYFRDGRGMMEISRQWYFFYRRENLFLLSYQIFLAERNKKECHWIRNYLFLNKLFILRIFFRQFYAPASRPPWRKKWFLGLVGFIVFISIIYLMYHFGRTSDNELDGFHYEEWERKFEHFYMKYKKF